jgi:putative CRISPR-associated protein (TIGR02619 family)
VTSCGTSILSNANRELVKESDRRDIQPLLTKYANSKEQDIEEQDRDELKRFLNQTQKLLSNWSKSKDLKKLRQLSAELNGLTRLIYNPNKNRDCAVLISTDTFLGKQTVEILSKCLNDLGWFTSTETIDGLNTKDTETFLAGVANLAAEVSERAKNAKRKNNEIVFNLSGGFKALQGVMQMLATFHADKTIYIFESSDELLEIPTLPIQPDYEIVEKKLREFRRMGRELKVTLDQVCDIPPSLLKYQDDNDCKLSAWGKVFWATVKNKKRLYENQIYDPPSELIEYSKKFKGDCEELKEDRRKILNERLDDLAVYLESNREINLNGLRVKKIEGNEKAPSTHEFKAWSDQDAKRVFFHYEGKVAVLDALDKGLGH